MQDSLTAGAPLSAAAAHRHRGRLRDWLREGLRAGVFLRPRLPAPAPFPLHVLALALLTALLQLLLRRLAIDGDAQFHLAGWLGPWCITGALIGAAWWLFAAAGPRDGQPAAAAWYTLWCVAGWPLIVVSGALEIAAARGSLQSLQSPLGAGLAWLLAWGWDIALAVALARRLGLPRKSAALLGTLVFALFLLDDAAFGNWPAWLPMEPEGEAPARLQLNQETFERQQAVWKSSIDALAPQRPGVRDVYGIVFAPYGSEDVFLRESNLAATVLRERFDAEGRVLQLLNHLSTGDKLPWATPLNLERAIDAAAQVMDKDEDVLVVYMTSHGGRDFKLSSSFWPLEVPDLTPQQLRAALDKAGIRHRVLMVSACYSGGWVEPLASDTTLVMTAADATHTSYGCGRRSELTYFGRAMWDEQLRKTHSFEEAFAAAVPVIEQREKEAKKADGFSNPQIRVGPAIRPVLADVAARLDKPAAP